MAAGVLFDVERLASGAGRNLLEELDDSKRLPPTTRERLAQAVLAHAEVVSIVAEEAIYSLDGPVVRITTPHIPLAANPVLEDAQMPSAERIASTIRATLEATR